MTLLRLVDETSGDTDAIHALTAAAFGREVEAAIVDLARRANDITWSIVALDDGTLVGHVMASPMTLTPDPGLRCIAIGPISVAPDRQGEGIGSTLMVEVIDRARAEGYDAILLLGNPDYYRRFGFETAPIGNEYGATDAFMSLELKPGVFDGVACIAKYTPAFAQAEGRTP